MKDKQRFLHIFETVVSVISAAMTIWGIICLFNYYENNKKENQRQQEIQQIRNKNAIQLYNQMKREDSLSKSPAYQIERYYDEYTKLHRKKSLSSVERILMNKAKTQLNEWIPKYSEELVKKKNDALSEADSMMIDYCDEKLIWLKNIENEVFY